LVRGGQTGGLPRPTVVSQMRDGALATGVPAAPGGAFVEPHAVAVDRRAASGTTSSERLFVWVVAAACAAFLMGGLAMQPRPDLLRPDEAEGRARPPLRHRRWTAGIPSTAVPVVSPTGPEAALVLGAASSPAGRAVVVRLATKGVPTAVVLGLDDEFQPVLDEVD